MRKTSHRDGMKRSTHKKNEATRSRALRTMQNRLKRGFDPMPQSYGPLRQACILLNRRLFDGKLPPCLVTLQRSRHAYGFFAGRRFRSAKGARVIDEIALNPAHFASRGAKKVLSTLAHELAHQWQHHLGKPPSTAYHNRQWAEKMRSIGLIPSDTGRPGGRQTGRQMTHYIKHSGPFDHAADEMIAKGFVLAIVERSSPKAKLIALKKKLSKTAYYCPRCFAKAWAKAGSDFLCRPCRARLVS